jgi:multiple sugar transport system ATP-binding protein
MAFGLKLRKASRNEIDRKVREAASILRIEDLLKRKPKQLSGGQRQRVAVGRAIVREPKVFLMDEPLSNLDAKLRVTARSEISKLYHRLGTTFIYVTHDQVEAMTMGTTVVVLKDGLLQQADTPYNLYTSPTNVFVAGFIGSPAMNFFDATLSDDDGALYVETGAFRAQLPADKAAVYRRHVGKNVIFGMRPEDIHDAEFAPPGIYGAPVEGRVDVTELMGKEVEVHLLADTQSFVSIVDPRTSFSVGNHVQVVMNMDNAHIFDRETQVAIRS